MSEEAPDGRPKAPRRKKLETGVAIGAALVGFEQAVFRTLPPAQEVVARSRHDDPVPSDDGAFVIILPPLESIRRGRPEN